MKVSKGSLAHKFIQEIRDETHRFSITKQRKKLNKLSTSSALDVLEGVGPKRKKLLIRYFGSVEQIKRASTIDLINVPGLGKKTAASIYNQLN
jgi:excinuclease ABC subunit C